MSAAKSIDACTAFFLLPTICVAVSIFGCSPRQPTAPSSPASGDNVSVVAGVDTTKENLNSNPPRNDKTPAVDLIPGNSIADTAADLSMVHPTEQLPPTDALALRQEAKQLADEVIRRFPNSPDALEIKARFLMLFGETEAAKNCWLAALKLDANYAYALQGLGKVAILNSEFEQAIEYLKKSIPSQPTNADPVHDLSDAYMKVGKPDESIACLRAFADNNPQSALTFLLLGQSYLAKEQFEDAEKAFRTVLQISPGQPRAENGLATALVRLGKREEAKQLLASQKANRKANDKNRSPEEVFRDELKELSKRFHAVAEFYSANGDKPSAEQVALRALVLDPNNLQPKALLVDIFQEQGRLKPALELVGQLAVSDQENPRWPYTRGALLILLKDKKGARQAYEEVVRLAPASAAGYESLARLAIEMRSDLKSAVEFAQKAVEIRGTAADYELLAQAHAVNSDFSRAHEYLSEAIRRDSANEDYLEAMRQLRKAMSRSE